MERCYHRYTCEVSSKFTKRWIGERELPKEIQTDEQAISWAKEFAVDCPGQIVTKLQCRIYIIHNVNF